MQAAVRDGYVRLIDSPGRTYDVRADVADKYEICPHCHGSPVRYQRIGNVALIGWEWNIPYLMCGACGGSGARYKSAASLPRKEEG